jgi:protein associated with RNAse G/E
MSQSPVTVNSRKYDLTISRSWNCELVRQEENLLVLKGVFDTEVRHPELGLISAGTTSHEFFWFDRWFNIFQFFEPDGSLRNYYGNVCMPPTFDGRVLDYVDLDIDVVVWPDRRHQILDEDEFAVNAEIWKYPEHVRQAAKHALKELLAMAADCQFPFSR